MDIIEKQADNFLRLKFESSENARDFIDKLKLELNNYNRNADKVKFTQRVFNHAKKERDDHFKACKNPKTCSQLSDLDDIVFFTQQELEENGISHNNLFDSSESFSVKQKIDELINELKNIKTDLEKVQTGQQITYDDFIEEFETLKKQLYLDKTTLRQILLGKIFEMTMSGIISETLSKKLIELFGDIFTKETIKRLTE